MADRRLVWQKRLAPVLRPAAWLYGASMSARRAAYARGLLPTVRSDRPVISVGSLLAGGTGKTPMVAHLARHFASTRTAVLSRGYGGSYRGRRQVTHDCPATVCGDEPVLLARTCPADVWVGRDRAQLALELSGRYDLFLLDDGYQHVKLERFLNICLLPHEDPGPLLPAGLWREGASALAAADVVVGLHGWPAWVDSYYEGPRVIVELAPGSWQSTRGGQPEGPVFAFTGVARPERFLNSLGGLDVRGSAVFADHHVYSPGELKDLGSRARQLGAFALVTTAKDAVRTGDVDLPLYWRDLEVRFVEGEPDFAMFLESVTLPE